VIAKVHPSHPQTSEQFAHAVSKSISSCHVPEGIFSIIHGKNPRVSEELIMQEDVAAVGFTGSYGVGRSLFNLACSRKTPIPVFAEMGSINPIFITKQTIEKNGKQISKLLTDSIMTGTGQFCTKPGVIFIPKTAKGFIKDVVEQMKNAEPGILLNETIQRHLQENIIKTCAIDQVLVASQDHKDSSHHRSVAPTVLTTDIETFHTHQQLQQEHFGPFALLVLYNNMKECIPIVEQLEGQLTGTIHLDESEIMQLKPLIEVLSRKVGRLIINGVPTGVRVCTAMQHGGPYPATTAPHTTSVGMMSVKRFLRPIAYQDTPDDLLPTELKNTNSLRILRLINQHYTREDIQINKR
jgi:NADP-dependent aldehyde dehydrogenase